MNAMDDRGIVALYLRRDETAIRQLVAQVKVLSKSEISVTLKSGIEIRQSISN